MQTHFLLRGPHLVGYGLIRSFSINLCSGDEHRIRKRRKLTDVKGTDEDVQATVPSKKRMAANELYKSQ